MKKAAVKPLFHDQMSPITSDQSHWREKLQQYNYNYRAKTVKGSINISTN